MTDDEGNSYSTVQIGGQCWMAESINIGTMLTSGSSEPNTSDQVIEKWCHGNSPSNCEDYGGLYNWNEAMRGSSVSGARGICPSGWHVPTDAEYNTLEKTVIGVIDSSASQYPCDLNTTGWQRCADDNGSSSGGTYGAGRSLQKVGTYGRDDLVGFKGLTSGYRHPVGSFSNLGSTLNLWSSTPASASSAWRRGMLYSYSAINRAPGTMAFGFSVRCLKD